MPTRAVSLTDKQQRFVELYVLDSEVSGHQTNSAVAAGYSAESAAVAASRLLRHPGVRAAIETLNRELLGDYATASIRYLGKLVMDTQANPKHRLDAAKTLLDRGGYIPPRAPDAPPPPLDPADINKMPLDKLLRMILAREEKDAAMERDMIDVTPGVDDATPATVEAGPAAAAG